MGKCLFSVSIQPRTTSEIHTVELVVANDEDSVRKYAEKQYPTVYRRLIECRTIRRVPLTVISQPLFAARHSIKIFLNKILKWLWEK